MSQIGMQLPGARRTRPAGLNVYTGVMAAAVVALLAAVVVLYMAGKSVGPSDKGALTPLSVHEDGRLNLGQ